MLSNQIMTTEFNVLGAHALWRGAKSASTKNEAKQIAELADRTFLLRPAMTLKCAKIRTA